MGGQKNTYFLKKYESTGGGRATIRENEQEMAPDGEQACSEKEPRESFSGPRGHKKEAAIIRKKTVIGLLANKNPS